MFRIARIGALAALAVMAAASALAQQNRAPPPPPALVQAVSATEAAKADYAFDYVLQNSKQNWRAHYDPARPAPKLHMIAPRREEMDGGEGRAFDGLAEKIEGVTWCASENMGRVADVRLVRDEGATATYSFQPDEDSTDGAARNLVRHLRGEFTLDKATPDVVAMRIYAPEPVSPIPLTRLTTLDISIQCALAPNGRRYAAQTTTRIAGSALGQNFNETSVQRTSNLVAP